MARDRSQQSIDLPHGCVNEFLQARWPTTPLTHPVTHKRNFVVKCEGDSLVWNHFITKPKEKNVGDMAYYIPTVWKSGGARLPHLIAPMR